MSGNFFHITSKQVEDLCRWNLPSHKGNLIVETPAVTAIPRRAPAGPSLNYDDVPEAGFRSRHRRSARHQQKHAQDKHRPPRFQTVVEDSEEDNEWPTIHDNAFSLKDKQQVQAQWPCASCTFLNDSALTVCEMCDQHRIEPIPARTINGEAQVNIGNTSEADLSASEGLSTGSKNWPSLQQAAEKSWDLCEQSSLASSMIDIARLEDVEAARGDDAGNQVAAARADAYPVEFYGVLSDTGASRADEESSDTTSMASWLHVASPSEAFQADGQAESASVASTWMDVGNLADFEAGGIESSSTSAWHGVAEQPISCETNSSESHLDVKSEGVRSATSWSSLVSRAGGTGTIQAPKRSGVPMPPLTRCQAPRKKVASLDVEEVYEDEQDGRGRARASRQYRQRR